MAEREARLGTLAVRKGFASENEVQTALDLQKNLEPAADRPAARVGEILVEMGALTGDMLKVLLEAAFEGLSDEGWLKLSRNWGVFFLFLAVLNTALLYTISFESWLAAKLWLFLPISFLFTFTQLPMLLRHGLTTEGAKEEETTPPPTG